MLAFIGPVNISGNKVSTSTFIVSLPETAGMKLLRLTLGGRRSHAVVVFDNLQATAQASPPTASNQQRSNGVNGDAFSADDPADIGGVQAQFINRRTIAFHRRDGHSVWLAHQSFD